MGDKLTFLAAFFALLFAVKYLYIQVFSEWWNLSNNDAFRSLVVAKWTLMCFLIKALKILLKKTLTAAFCNVSGARLSYKIDWNSLLTISVFFFKACIQDFFGKHIDDS